MTWSCGRCAPSRLGLRPRTLGVRARGQALRMRSVVLSTGVGMEVAAFLILPGTAQTRRAGLACADRRHADRLPRLEPGVGLHPAAVDPHLPGAQQLLEMPEADIGIVGAEPAIEAHPRLVRADRDRLELCHDVRSTAPAAGCHARRSRSRQRPHQPHAEEQARRSTEPRTPRHRPRRGHGRRAPTEARHRARRRRRW